MNRSVVSVCMATCNGEKYLQRQIDTILLQLGEEDELIISDDASTDHTISMINNYKDNRIKLLQDGPFGSPVRNIENALKNAGGEYVFLADQDDVWLPEKINKMVARLQHVDLAVCNACIVDEKEAIIHPSYFEWKGSGSGFWKNLAKNSFIGCAMAFRRKILSAALPFPKNIAMHDVWIGLLAESLGKVSFMNDCLMLYRRHEDNFTAAVHKSDEHLSDFSLRYKLTYRSVLLQNVFQRYFREIFLKQNH